MTQTWPGELFSPQVTQSDGVRRAIWTDREASARIPHDDDEDDALEMDFPCSDDGPLAYPGDCFFFRDNLGKFLKSWQKKSQSEGILESPVGLLGTRQGTWLMFWVWLIPVAVDLCGFRGKVFGSFKKFKLCLNSKCFAHQSNRNNEIDPLSDHLSSINLIFHSPNRRLFTTDKKKHPF